MEHFSLKKIFFVIIAFTICCCSVKADIIMTPVVRECSTDSKLIDCPNVKYYGKDANENDINKPQKPKRQWFKFFNRLFKNPAYADEIDPDFIKLKNANAQNNPIEQNNDNSMKILFSLILLILIFIAVYSLKKRTKGNNSDNTNG